MNSLLGEVFCGFCPALQEKAGNVVCPSGCAGLPAKEGSIGANFTNAIASAAGLREHSDMAISVIRIRTPLRFNDALQLQHAHGAELEHSPEKSARLFLLQHAPVYTLGRKTERQHLPFSEQELAKRTKAEVVAVDRGGSVTYHGPGQLTAYMLLNLQVWQLPIHQHLDLLEAAAIAALARFGIRGQREAGLTGVWVDVSETGRREKICAIGVSARRWVTYHGLSLNVDLDLAPFAEIIPCGLAGKAVTSIARVLGRRVEISEAEEALAAAFGEVYAAPLETGLA